MLKYRPLAHPVACRCALLGVIEQSLKPVIKLFPLQLRRNYWPATLNIVASCCVRLHVAWRLLFLVSVWLRWCQFTSVDYNLAATNECESSLCLNNGNCIDQINAFNCSRPPEFAGIDVKLVTRLSVLACYNFAFLNLNQGHPTTIFGKYLFGRRLEI